MEENYSMPPIGKNSMMASMEEEMDSYFEPQEEMVAERPTTIEKDVFSVSGVGRSNRILAIHDREERFLGQRRRQQHQPHARGQAAATQEPTTEHDICTDDNDRSPDDSVAEVPLHLAAADDDGAGKERSGFLRAEQAPVWNDEG